MISVPRVLLVEDDDIDIIGMRRAFGKLQVDVELTCARDGVEALQIMRGESGDAPLQRPYLVLLDLNMPRMNGLEFLEHVRTDPALHDTVVFVLTTSASPEDKAKAYRLNIAGYMVKEGVGEALVKRMSMIRHYCEVVELPH